MHEVISLLINRSDFFSPVVMGTYRDFLIGVDYRYYYRGIIGCSYT